MLKSGFICHYCDFKMIFVNYADVKDNYCWRCMNKNCSKYKSRKNIRDGSFFSGLNLSFLLVIKILIRWSCNVPQHSILEILKINTKTFRKIINNFLKVVRTFDFKDNKLGGEGRVVQIDETGLNFKIKAHRGRPPMNKTDALCIVEVEDQITRAFACVIANKKAETLIPIITDNVLKNSTIWTDEHKSYHQLNRLEYSHDTFCHKYEFINKETGANTQAVESFNNEIN